MVLLEKNAPSRAKEFNTIFICQTYYGHAVDAKHERFKVWFNVRYVVRRFYDAALETGSMYDLQERIDVFNKKMTKPEDLYGIWMQRGEISWLLPCAKKKLIIFVVYQIPCIFNRVITHIIV